MILPCSPGMNKDQRTEDSTFPSAVDLGTCRSCTTPCPVPRDMTLLKTNPFPFTFPQNPQLFESSSAKSAWI